MSNPEQPKGCVVWLTGLSGAGKSTTAEHLVAVLRDRGATVTLFDGDAVRRQMSNGLGFSRADRDANVLRVASLARDIVDGGHIAVCALISPYRAARAQARSVIGADRFIEVFVDTPLDVCEKRDTKGLYARSRRGDLVGLTGVDDPYEPPLAPDVTLDTVACSPDENATAIVTLLVTGGFVGGGGRRIGSEAGG